MLSPNELGALAELLNRVPMTRPEALWLGGILARLEAAGGSTAPPDAPSAPDTERLTVPPTPPSTT